MRISHNPFRALTNLQFLASTLIATTVFHPSPARAAQFSQNQQLPDKITQVQGNNASWSASIKPGTTVTNACKEARDAYLKVTGEAGKTVLNSQGNLAASFNDGKGSLTCAFTDANSDPTEATAVVNQ